MFTCRTFYRVACCSLIVAALLAAAVYLRPGADVAAGGEEALSEQELQAIIGNIVSARNDALLRGDAQPIRPLYQTQTRNGLWAYDHEEKKTRYLANWSEKQGVQFVSIQSTVNIRWSRAVYNGYIVNMMLSTPI